MSKDEIISLLGLEPHPFESGYFKRTYESQQFMAESDNKSGDTSLDDSRLGNRRRLCTSIFYLLTKDNPINILHRNKSDIIHYFHLGDTIKYTTVTNEGMVKEQTVGANLKCGDQLQLLVPGGEWKAAQLCEDSGIGYGLISEVVVPGFEYEDNEVATTAQIKALFQELHPRLCPLIKA